MLIRLATAWIRAILIEKASISNEKSLPQMYNSGQSYTRFMILQHGASVVP